MRTHGWAARTAASTRIRPDGTGLRQVGDIRTGESQTAPLQISLQDPVLSPDGKTLAYWSWESKAGGSPDSYVHIRDLTTGQDQLLDLYPFHDSGYGPHFSPDGTLLLYESHSATSPGNDQLVIAPVDGSQPARPIGPSYYYQSRQGFDFSPDGTKVFLNTLREDLDHRRRQRCDHPTLGRSHRPRLATARSPPESRGA